MTERAEAGHGSTQIFTDPSVLFFFILNPIRYQHGLPDFAAPLIDAFAVDSPLHKQPLSLHFKYTG